VRLCPLLLLILSLAACNRGAPNNEALRQAVIDRMAQKGVGGVDVAITSVKMNGSEADVVASITPKGGSPANAMSMPYRVQQQGGKWVVVGTQESSPHGGAAVPAPANPHGGAVPEAAPGGAGKMPSPEDLPPTKKK
jgi:hypothetical protein